MNNFVFPQIPTKDNSWSSDYGYGGMDMRQWFATFAPEPTKEEINEQWELDKIRNPHGESHKPKRRSRLEIITDLKFEYADAMIAASKRSSDADR
jgi:hypothetical protein